MKLYHREVYWPVGIDRILPQCFESWNEVELQYSPHARKEANSDRYGKVKLPETINLETAYIFEVEINDSGVLNKIVARVPYNNKFDLVIVMKVNQYVVNYVIVKTIWLNSVDDKHKTLDESKYERNPNGSLV